MRFLRWSDYLLNFLYEDDDIIAIDKPYGFNAHTNDSIIEHSEYIQDGLIEMYEKQLQKKLHIIHRLDQTTTGVMIFGKSVESAKKYAEYFFQRKVQKNYWFITKHKSKQDKYYIDQVIVHKAKDLEADTDFEVVKKWKNYEMWEAHPHTGRNHQIRIHAKAAGISILGDPKYGGHEHQFLCLHNHKIEFPNGIVITSQTPKYFEDLSLLEDKTLARTFFEMDRRKRLFLSSGQDQCYRLVHEVNNSKQDGFTLDQFGNVIVLNWFNDSWTESDLRRFSFFAKTIGKSILVKLNKKASSQQSGGQEELILLNPQEFFKEDGRSWTAMENNTKYMLKTDSGQSVGLILNQRLQRDWVLRNSKSKIVLNLFAHTCSYGLMATMGEAKEVTCVDSNKNALNWGRQNFEINNVTMENSKFYLRDSVSFIEQCLSKKFKFDLIICDAPSFQRREKGFFKIEKDLEKLLESCLGCLNKNGQMLLSTNYDSFFIGDLKNLIIKVQKKINIKNMDIDCILAGLDFELPNEKTNLKSFLITLRD